MQQAFVDSNQQLRLIHSVTYCVYNDRTVSQEKISFRHAKSYSGKC